MSEIVLTDTVQPTLAGLSKVEGEAIAAMDGVLHRYRLCEWIRCRVCFGAQRQDGARSRVTARSVMVECRCGVRQYEAPKGTTDLTPKRSRLAVPAISTSTMTVIDGNGATVTLPSVRLDPEDAAIIRFYSKVIGALNLNSKLAHRDCWDGTPYDASAMEVLVDPSNVALRCGCRVLHFSGSTDH